MFNTFKLFKLILFMRVAMYYNNNDVRLEEMEKPEIKEGEILVKSMASGICGSDIMEWYRIKKAPLVLGHEMTGIIEESKNKKYKPGQRVFVSHHVPCGSCKYCKAGHDTACDTLHKTNFYPGGFSEYVRVPEINTRNGVFIIPDSVSYEDATLMEPLATVIRGQKIAEIGKERVIILGSGIVGILHIQLAKLANAHVIATDVSDYRLKMAKRFGADEVINASDLKAKADKVIICSGAAASQALQCVDRGGTILFFAVPSSLSLPISELWKNEVTIKTSYATGPSELKEALELIKKKKINVHDMITHRFGLAEAGKGFKLAADAKESLKIIIEPQK